MEMHQVSALGGTDPSRHRRTELGLVPRQPAATVCELDLGQHAIRSGERAQTLDPNQRPENCPMNP
jgi:hypothetical protein